MRAADLYVSAAKIEGLPFNIVEALGCGCTTVASDVKGHNDVLHGVGLLYQHGNEAQFVSCVNSVFTGEFKVSADALAERYKRYSKDTVFEETLGVIKEALVL